MGKNSKNSQRKTILVLPDPEEETGVEKGAQKTVREERNKKAKEAAKEEFENKIKLWKETSASGLNLSAANQKAKSVLYMMPGTEGQNRHKQSLPHEKVT